jgi:hypothetical protein
MSEKESESESESCKDSYHFEFRRLVILGRNQLTGTCSTRRIGHLSTHGQFRTSRWNTRCLACSTDVTRWIALVCGDIGRWVALVRSAIDIELTCENIAWRENTGGACVRCIPDDSGL